jgi:hypothetical protein
MGFGLTYWSFFRANLLCFFAGLMFAYSWYGIRCLRLLGIDSYQEWDL